MTPCTQPPVPLEALQFVGQRLVRPECVLATRAGTLYSADWRGGVAATSANGAMSTMIGAAPPGDRAMRPNGIALCADGSFLLADLGENRGGVFRLAPSGEVTPFLEEVDGVELPPTNFVCEDAQGRLWITVSTRRVPRADAYRADVCDGFIVLVDRGRACIVAEGLGYTNEAALSPDRRWLYVNETFSRRLSRFPVDADGSLGPKEVVTTFGHGTFPDGLAFDSQGQVWITSIVSNRVLRVAPDGQATVILEDADAAHLQWCEAAYLSGTLGRQHLDRAAGRVLKNISSLAFGGPDLRTAYLGCLLGDAIASFRVEVAGLAPVHWER